MIHTLRRELVSFLVPPLCVACREPEFSGEAVCLPCRSSLVPLRDPRCTCCGAPVARRSAGCRECRGRKLGFACAWSALSYEGVCRRIVTAVKSRGELRATEFMAAQIAAHAPGDLLGLALVPVPAHPRRRRRHGFNQAELIARALARRTAAPVLGLLARAGTSGPQVGLERDARLVNARGSVRSRSLSRPPRRAVLVDDVYTTGATLDACAWALRGAGVEEVFALTFARAVRG